VTVTCVSVPRVAATSAAVKPSPPSAIGAVSTRAPGWARRTPAAMASAASVALRPSLKPDGAIRTVIVMVSSRVGTGTATTTDGAIGYSAALTVSA
jgi:hypothetical protein